MRNLKIREYIGLFSTKDHAGVVDTVEQLFINTSFGENELI